MNRKVKIALLIFISIILVAIIAGESYIFFLSDNPGHNQIVDKPNDKTKEEIIDRSKYLVNIFTPYMKHNLDQLYEVKSEKLFYYLIDGLTDTVIEEKINQKIEQKALELHEKYPDRNIGGYIVSNFANTLSINFIVTNRSSEEFQNVNKWGIAIGTLNIDLTTGNEFFLNDVILDYKNVIREILIKDIYEYASINIGIICEGGPCENPNPDYSSLEEGVLSVINKFNSDDYLFTFDAEGINLYFDDVFLKVFEDYNYGYIAPEQVIGECQDVKRIESDYEENFKICSYIETSYYDKIYFKNMYDSVIIYDRFNGNSTMYKKTSTEVAKKFMNDYTNNEGIRFEEKDNQLIDYFIALWDSEKVPLNKLFDDVIEESSNLKTENFNIFNISGEKVGYYLDKFDYYKFDVYHYNLKKDEYLANKEKIYISNYDRYYIYEGDLVFTKGYDFLEKYLDRKNFYYYIYDLEGNRVKTSDVFSTDFDFSTIIPNEWLSLGSYENFQEFLDDCLLIINGEYFESKNKPVFYIDDSYSRRIYIKYKGNKVDLANGYEELNDLIEKIFK